MLSPLNTYEEKSWDPQNTHKEIFKPLKYPWEKILRPWSTHKKHFAPTNAWWHKTQETHNGMKPTEFSTLTINTLSKMDYNILNREMFIKKIITKKYQKDIKWFHLI